ncbi:class 1 fructose-bisphosphatase [Paroceanicella profunda]|uniref:Fructose-1,6-bisphosphatase class 1 n=1 Tax=Paroceanicella profunda TaxID=2579971 RepID=A0A5B8FVF3_9RHOB|nr:class 1 fructose-bisphosphatase [Paroceanicella profunda]QDL92786.1 class 1 fructose-bisphosphatase [Paroceanicella profunda]
MTHITSLHEHLLLTGADPVVAGLIGALGGVAVEVSRLIARGGLSSSLGAAVGRNSDGDGQKALDMIADDAFAACLPGTGVRWLVSEEREGVTEIDPSGTLALAIDPLDGSSNIDVNVSIGTIFSIRAAQASPEESFLAPADGQLAAGYVIYGPQTALLLTWGAGVSHYVLDPGTGRFGLVNDRVRVPPRASEFAINASNFRHWSKPVRAYVDDCLSGAAGPLGRDYNMRWIASLVAETHRILMRGGIFLYPADARPGYQHGRLRLVYECAPIAFLMEQAGGRATDGADPILSRAASGLHARTPFVFGSAEKVARVAAYHDLPEAEISPLFGIRGLFKT